MHRGLDYLAEDLRRAQEQRRLASAVRAADDDAVAALLRLDRVEDLLLARLRRQRVSLARAPEEWRRQRRTLQRGHGASEAAPKVLLAEVEESLEVAHATLASAEPDQLIPRYDRVQHD